MNNTNKNPSTFVNGFLFGGEEETRTPAPVTRPTPLAGAPRHQLEYFSVLVTIYMNFKLFDSLAERKGFEPLALASHWFSRPAP